jgi:hypothetical protein
MFEGQPREFGEKAVSKNRSAALRPPTYQDADPKRF